MHDDCGGECFSEEEGEQRLVSSSTVVLCEVVVGVSSIGVHDNNYLVVREFLCLLVLTTP